MKSVTKPSSKQIMRGRGIGALVGTLIGAGWMAYGLRPFPDIARDLGGLAGSVAAAWLLVDSLKSIASAKRLPAPNAASQSANHRIWTLFWINFAAEIVLLNVAINFLAQPALHIYWISAISLVVGLHFLPMAIFFREPSYWHCGAAMIGMAGATTLVLRSGVASPELYTAGEALVNAVILGSVAAWGIQPARLPRRFT
ncbi:MAG: hypothetical protein ABI178_00530 [Rhodanobacter sp.]